MLAFAFKEIAQRPVAFLLVECDHPSMNHRALQTRVAVVLDVQHVIVHRRGPLPDNWSHVLTEREQPSRYDLADISLIHSNRVVIRGRTKQISFAFACRIDIGPRISNKRSVVSEDLKRQRVGMRVRASTVQSVIAAIHDRVEIVSSLNVDLRTLKSPRALLVVVHRALKAAQSRCAKPPQHLFVRLARVFETPEVKQTRGDRQQITMLVGIARLEADESPVIRISDRRRGAVRLQISAYKLKHPAQTFGIALRDVQP